MDQFTAPLQEFTESMHGLFGPFVEQDLLQQIEDGLLGLRNGQRIKGWPLQYMIQKLDRSLTCSDLHHAACCAVCYLGLAEERDEAQLLSCVPS